MSNKISMVIIPKTIYADVVDMPDPMILGVTIHAYNHSDSTLYMQISGSGPSGWNTNSVNLNTMSSGAGAYFNLDNFLSRTRPASAITESVTLTLRGYSDSGYTTLIYTFQRTVTVVFIKSNDGSWTTDFSDNFDDGTVDGWAANYSNFNLHGCSASASIATDYVLSSPYSCKGTITGEVWYGNYGVCGGELYKSFTTGIHTTTYAIINVRLGEDSTGAISPIYAGLMLSILQDSTVLTYLGIGLLEAYETDKFPRNRWVRIVVPLPSNTTFILRIRTAVALNCSGFYGDGPWINNYIWIDDFKIISQ